MLRSVVAVRRQERGAATLAVIGDSWFEWVAEAVGVVVVGLVISGVLPVWTLAMAALALFRPLSRLLMALAHGVGESQPAVPVSHSGVIVWSWLPTTLGGSPLAGFVLTGTPVYVPLEIRS